MERRLIQKGILLCITVLLLFTACGKEVKKAENPVDEPVKEYVYPGENRIMSWNNPAYGKEEYAEGNDLRVWVSNQDDPEREYTYHGTIHWVENQGNHIFSLLCLPSDYDGTQKYPLLLMAHGFNSTFQEYNYFTNYLTENGYAVLYFDFRGGHASQGLSDGKLIQMSYDTKLSDIRVMTEYASSLPMADPQKMIFVGHSQGGMMGLITACDEDLKTRFLGMLLFSPYAFRTTYLEEFGSIDNLPDSYSLLMQKVGKDYLYSAIKYDGIIWDGISAYDKPVKIWIGDSDELIPVETAVKLAETFGDNASYEVVPGGFHDFRADVLPKLMPESILPFLNSLVK